MASFAEIENTVTLGWTMYVEKLEEARLKMVQGCRTCSTSHLTCLSSAILALEYDLETQTNTDLTTNTYNLLLSFLSGFNGTFEADPTVVIPNTEWVIVSDGVTLEEVQELLAEALGDKLDKNASITGATKTKVTYDEKGLVIGGDDATTADIDPSSDRNYVTDAEKAIIASTSGTNTGDQDLSNLVEKVSGKGLSTEDYTTLEKTKISEFVTPEQYGAVGNGITDDRTALVNAIASGKQVNLSAKTYFVSAPISLTDNKTISGQGRLSVIKVSGDYEAFTIGGSNITLSKFEILGNGRGTSTNYATTRPSQHGIKAEGNVELSTNYNNIIIDNVVGNSLGGALIYGKNLVGTLYNGGIKASSCIAESCFIGYHFDTRSEYNSLSNCYAFNNQYGLISKGGNNNIIGGQYNSNRIGQLIEGESGTNDSHSVSLGCTVNHNLDFGVKTDGVTVDYKFLSCYIYINDIYIKDSVNIEFQGCNFSVPNLYVQDSTNTAFSNNNFTTETTRYLSWNGTNNTGSASTVKWFNNNFFLGNPTGLISEIYNIEAKEGFVLKYGSNPTNGVLYLNNEGVITSDNQNLFYDGNFVVKNGNFGVGDSAPDMTGVFKDTDAKVRITSGLEASSAELYFGWEVDKYAGYISYNNATGVLIKGAETSELSLKIDNYGSDLSANYTSRTKIDKGYADATYKQAEFGLACSDETTDLTSGTAKVTFRVPYAMTIISISASVNAAPVGSTLVVDINENGTSILSTKLSIDAGEKTSTTAATPYVLSDTVLAADSEITIDIDQVGASTAGKGLKVFIIGTRN